MPLQPAPTGSPGSNRRRSQRVLVQVSVVVYGLATDSKPFKEESVTMVVNAHGALFALAASVKHGQKVMLSNKGTKEEQESRVVFLGPKEAGKTQVGVEFLRPAPHFWRIDFPPADWKPVGE